MMTFNLVFDVRAASAEEAIAAVMALKDSTWGKPGRVAADYGEASASQQPDGRWEVVLPAASATAGKVVFEAAEAAGTSDGQIEFDLRASRPSAGAPVTLPGTAVGPGGAPVPPPPAPAPPQAPQAPAPAPQAPAPPPQPQPAPAPQAPAPVSQPAPQAPQAPAPSPQAPPPPQPAPPPPPQPAPQPAPPPPQPAPQPAPPPQAPPAPPPQAPPPQAPPPQAPSGPPPAAGPPGPPPGPPGAPPGPPGPPGAPPGPPMSPMMAPPTRGAFFPTHVVSGRGTPAWDQPDPTKPSSQTLAPWSEVQVIDRIGSWANIVTDDGWEGWCDMHQLIVRAGGRRR